MGKIGSQLGGVGLALLAHPCELSLFCHISIFMHHMEVFKLILLYSAFNIANTTSYENGISNERDIVLHEVRYGPDVKIWDHYVERQEARTKDSQQYQISG